MFPSSGRASAMPFDIIDKLRRSGSIFKIENSRSQFDAAICSALLAPDVLQHVSSSGLEHVSGGCWLEDGKASVNTSQDSSSPGHPRPHCSSWHCSQCSSYGQEEHAGTPEAVGAAFYADPVWQHCIRVEGCRSQTPCAPPRHQHTQKRGDQISHPTMDNFACMKPCNPCRSPEHSRLERSSATDCGTSVLDDSMHGFWTEETSNVIRTSDKQEAMRDSSMSSNTEPALHPLSAERVLANASTDTLSVTASSTILSHAMMPRVVRARATADESSDCDSMGSSSALSVEADEMIEMQSQAWKHLFRDVWRRARSIRETKGQRIGSSLRYRFNG